MEKEQQKRINRNNRKRGGHFEKVTADFLGMEVVPYSGSNARFGFGDVRDSIWLGECKNITPDGDKITLLHKWFDKNAERAASANRMPFFAWMPAGKSTKYIILDDSVFQKLHSDVIESIVLPRKVYNTKNLIIHIDADYIKSMKADNGIVAMRLDGCNEVWYMMRIELFRCLIHLNNLKG